MNVALLVCEAAPAYHRLFRDLLDRVPEGAEFSLHPYDVYDGQLPESVHSHEAYLITGSYAGAYENLPWISPLLDFVRAAHAVGIPLVGVCFGHQVLAQALGGRVDKAKVGWQLGVHTTRITRRYPWMDLRAGKAVRPRTNPERSESLEVSDPSLAADELQLIYVHQDQVTAVPPEATVCAATDLCPVAAFVLGDAATGETALGIQGHPEFTRAVTEHTIRSQPEKFPTPNAEPALRSLESREDSYGRDSDTVARWIAQFLLTARGAEIERLSAAPCGMYR